MAIDIKVPYELTQEEISYCLSHGNRQITGFSYGLDWERTRVVSIVPHKPHFRGWTDGQIFDYVMLKLETAVIMKRR